MDRVISAVGSGAAILTGRQLGIRIEPTTLLLFDLDTRTSLRTRPNPLTAEQVLRLRGARPDRLAAPASTQTGPGQRVADQIGVVSVCGQRVGVGRAYCRARHQAPAEPFP